MSDQLVIETSPQRTQTFGAFDYSDSSPESLVEEFSSSIDTTSDDSIETETHLSIVAISRPITDYRNNLTEIEGNYLTELLNATKILKTPYGSMTSEATTFIDAMHVLIGARASDIRRYYQMSKNLIGFKNICRSDQFSLLIPGFVESFFMRNVVGYFNDNDSEYFVIPTVRSQQLPLSF